MSWRLARSLATLRAQVNAMFPTRSKESDGSIGDEAHASRSSDHNPWISDDGEGVVSAIDITNDPRIGLSSEALCQALIASRDSRIKYLISNRRIYSGSKQEHPAWVARPYTGKNPHDHHVHISVKSDKEFYDDDRSWDLSHLKAPQLRDVEIVSKTLRVGNRGEAVKELQTLLNSKSNASLKVDGDFGEKTLKAVKEYQRIYNLVDDGIVGPQTWKTLKG